jgi:hypothetical protein
VSAASPSALEMLIMIGALADELEIETDRQNSTVARARALIISAPSVLATAQPPAATDAAGSQESKAPPAASRDPHVGDTVEVRDWGCIEWERAVVRGVGYSWLDRPCVRVDGVSDLPESHDGRAWGWRPLPGSTP